MTNWTVIGMVSVGNSDSTEFIDTNASGLSSRCYLLREH